MPVLPRSRIGLALAGGGPLGITYEIGALLALEEALDGIAFHELPIYVGVSAGAVVASALANGFTPAKLCHVLVLNQSTAFPVNPEHFLRLVWHRFGHRLPNLPGRLLKAAWGSLQNPRDISLQGAIVSQLLGALPPGMWDNERINHFLTKLYRSRGRTNDFRKLKRQLFVVAMNLDTGEIVRFGAPGQNHVSISKAVQASTAVPGLFPPVAIDGRYYVDGGVKKTVHASAALDAGAELLICINPIVSFNPRLAEPQRQKNLTSLVEGGLPAVMAQATRIVIHSRMKAGLARYAIQYPDQDVLLFEPNQRDADMFFAKIFSFAHRLRVCEHAYQATRADLRHRREVIEPLLARHGITLRTDILADPNRHFDSHLHIPPEFHRMAGLQHPVTNELSDALDQLESWVKKHRGQSSAVNAG
ncbi:MAG: patatin-like phospholipase family protein [Candidatus Competibacteraceae bacterium]|jgi:predicted acylesterase/phospholipase RssA|nr:patatin-like phospholipase family protein [Candidatus Competibacteraceae bacterium]